MQVQKQYKNLELSTIDDFSNYNFIKLMGVVSNHIDNNIPIEKLIPLSLPVISHHLSQIKPMINFGGIDKLPINLMSFVFMSSGIGKDRAVSFINKAFADFDKRVEDPKTENLDRIAMSFLQDKVKQFSYLTNSQKQQVLSEFKKKNPQFSTLKIGEDLIIDGSSTTSGFINLVDNSQLQGGIVSILETELISKLNNNSHHFRELIGLVGKTFDKGYAVKKELKSNKNGKIIKNQYTSLLCFSAPNNLWNDKVVNFFHENYNNILSRRSLFTFLDRNSQQYIDYQNSKQEYAVNTSVEDILQPTLDLLSNYDDYELKLSQSGKDYFEIIKNYNQQLATLITYGYNLSNPKLALKSISIENHIEAKPYLILRIAGILSLMESQMFISKKTLQLATLIMENISKDMFEYSIQLNSSGVDKLIYDILDNKINLDYKINMSSQFLIKHKYFNNHEILDNDFMLNNVIPKLNFYLIGKAIFFFNDKDHSIDIYRLSKNNEKQDFVFSNYDNKTPLSIDTLQDIKGKKKFNGIVDNQTNKLIIDLNWFSADDKIHSWLSMHTHYIDKQQGIVILPLDFYIPKKLYNKALNWFLHHLSKSEFKLKSNYVEYDFDNSNFELHDNSFTTFTSGYILNFMAIIQNYNYHVDYFINLIYEIMTGNQLDLNLAPNPKLKIIDDDFNYLDNDYIFDNTTSTKSEHQTLQVVKLNGIYQKIKSKQFDFMTEPSYHLLIGLVNMTKQLILLQVDKSYYHSQILNPILLENNVDTEMVTIISKSIMNFCIDNKSSIHEILDIPIEMLKSLPISELNKEMLNSPPPNLNIDDNILSTITIPKFE
jgi:hypothetical protein